MAYTPYYSGGWQSGEQGGTPITPAALNNIENGIGTLDTTHNLKTYTSVTQLNLVAGSATILSAFNAMPDGSALYAQNDDFSNGETPSAGVVEIVKRLNARAFVAFHAKTEQNHDYRMYEAATDYNNQDVNAPSGKWVLELDENVLPTKVLNSANLDNVKYNYHGYANNCTATGISSAIYGAFICSSNNLSGTDNRTAQLIFLLTGVVIYRIYGSVGWSSWQQFTTTAYTG